MAALLEDRRIREADEEGQRDEHKKMFDDLTAKLKRKEDLLQAATKDCTLNVGMLHHNSQNSSYKQILWSHHLQFQHSPFLRSY